MTANQRKKRVNAASFVGCTSREQYMVKRKKLELLQPNLYMIPTISLEWDNKKKHVVSKRDQIGISQRHLIPFTEPGFHCHNILADVFSVPREIFELENLSEILSYEAWQSLLSNDERSFLTQFLPKEAELDTLVQELLSGDNFHFGNPFLFWGASLCFGDLHPDKSIHEEKYLKACKKAYYSYLQKYHNDMIEHLRLWKEKWDSCEDPEVDIVQKIWRSRDHVEKGMPQLEIGLYDTEQNLAATPDSCSWANSEKAYSSDNQYWEIFHGDTERRKDCLNKTGDDSFSGKKVAAIPRKGEKLHKRNIQQGDGTKYMSYVKVSKQQHERVKSSMKSAGNSMQTRSLNNVLGTIDALNVQPFERFEEEEKKRLQDYWLKLANRDISEGFSNWRRRQLLRQQLIQSLGEEVEQKLRLEEATLDDEKEGSHNKLTELSDDSKEDTEQSDGSFLEQRGNQDAIHEIGTAREDEKDMKDYEYEEQSLDMDKIERDVPDHVFIQDHHQQQGTSIDNSTRDSAVMTEPSNPGVLQDQHQQKIGAASVSPRIKALEIESLGNTACAETDDPPVVSLYSVKLNHVNSPASQGGPHTSASEVWSGGDVHGSYYQSVAANTDFASSHELTLGHPQFIQEQPLRMLNLETDGQDKDVGKDILLGQCDNSSFFSSYTDQDRNELLHSFFKAQSSLPYHHEQKHLSLDYQPANELIMETGQYHGHLSEQVHSSIQLDLKQKRLNDLYIQQTLQDSIHSDGGRFTMPRRGHLAVSIHDWAPVNSIRMAANSQPHMSSGELSQNWYSGESGAQDVWLTFESAVGANHSLSGVNIADQSLFSVLSECNKVEPIAGYDSMGFAERFVQAGHYSGMDEGIPSSSVSRQAINTFNYLNGHEAAASGVKVDNLGWMGISKQNPGIHESVSRPFLRSWNQ